MLSFISHLRNIFRTKRKESTANRYKDFIFIFIELSLFYMTCACQYISQRSSQLISVFRHFLIPRCFRWPEWSVNTRDFLFLCVFPESLEARRQTRRKSMAETNLYSIFEMVAVHRSLVSCAMYTSTCKATYMSSQRVVVDEYGCS